MSSRCLDLGPKLADAVGKSWGYRIGLTKTMAHLALGISAGMSPKKNFI